MKDYETVFVLHPRLEDAEIEEEIQKVKDIITNGGGQIIDVQRWGRKRLAYEIRKVHEGIYTLIQFSSDTKVKQETDRRFKLNENILRHLTVVAHPSSIRKREETNSPETSEEAPAEEPAPVGESTSVQKAPPLETPPATGPEETPRPEDARRRETLGETPGETPGEASEEASDPA